MSSDDPFATVFLADDDDDSRTSLSETLRGDGYGVVEARDGAELLELLAESLLTPWHRPDVIITSALMPCYPGLGVLGALHQSRWDVPVILLTTARHAATVTRITRDALRLGAAAVFRKPFDVTDLRTAILAAHSGYFRVARPLHS